MKTYQTWLPIFSGFYGTYFEPDETNEIENINSERRKKNLPEITSDDCKFNYGEYRNEVGKKACQWVETQLKEPEIECTIEYEDISSPREYNFTNDSINVKIELDKEAVLSYLIKNKESLAKYFRERYTSRSGFISFYSPDIDWWIESFEQDKGKNSLDRDTSHICGAILDSILSQEEDAEMKMYEYVSEQVYLTCENYNELIEG